LLKNIHLNFGQRYLRNEIPNLGLQKCRSEKNQKYTPGKYKQSSQKLALNNINLCPKQCGKSETAIKTTKYTP
jgi:hypothetical protein